MRKRIASTVLAILTSCSAEQPRETARVASPIRRALHDLGAPDVTERVPAPIVATRDGRLVMRRVGEAVFFEDAGLRWSLASTGTRRWGIGATVVDARPQSMRAERPSGVVNEYLGARRTTAATAYSRVVWEEIRPGIDMIAEQSRGGVAYRFVLSPGAKLSDVALQWEGATAVRTVNNVLELETGIGVLRASGLRAFAVSGNARSELPVRHIVDGARVTFAVEGWDQRTPLVIDPTIAWSSYLGGSAVEAGPHVTTDSAGNLLVAGSTASTDYPLMGAFDTTAAMGDAFVTKISATGTMVWSTYLGGGASELAARVAVTSTGDVFVAGQTTSTDFPTMGAFDTTIGAFSQPEGFVTKLSGAGAMQWSTLLGGENHDVIEGVAADGSGNVIVVGNTLSTDFPTTGGFDTTKGAVRDAFVTKISGTGSLVWSTYLGGSADGDLAYAVATDASGNVLVTGETNSSDFPRTSGLGTGSSGTVDAFITKLSPSGALTWSQCRGLSGDDRGDAIATDAAGNVFVAGMGSNSFPVSGGFNTSVIGGGFLVKFSPAGAHLWSTHLGEGSSDVGLVVDGLGNAVTVGHVSGSTTFPTTGGFDTTLDGEDAFVMKVSSGGALFWSSFLGGSGQELASGVAVDGSNNIIIAGETTSTNFPSTGGFDTSLGGARDAFVTKLTFVPKGGACTQASQCVTSYCADGVCCDTACAGGCEACSAAKKGSGADGTCANVAKGTDPRNSCAADSGFPASCKSDGMCDGMGACNLWAPLGTACGGVICAAGTISGFVCNGGGTCADNTTTCAPFACDAMGKACRTTCAADAECATTAFCGTTGTCVAKKANGASCGKAVECTSGQCVDGVCCNSACAGQCESCNETGKEGTCSPIPSSGAPKGGRAACLGTGMCAGFCDGVNGGSCAYKTGTECGSACAAAAETISRCDDKGACTAGTPQGCNGLLCDGSTRCKTSCATSADCDTGFSCANGKCAPTQCSADGTSVISEGRETSCSPALCKGGRCVESCSASTDCASGFVCNSSTTKCEAPPATTEDEGGCTYGRSSNYSALLILAAMLGLARRRRA